MDQDYLICIGKWGSTHIDTYLLLEIIRIMVFTSRPSSLLSNKGFDAFKQFFLYILWERLRDRSCYYSAADPSNTFLNSLIV